MQLPQLSSLIQAFLPTATITDYKRLKSGLINQTFHLHLEAEGGSKQCILQQINRTVFGQPVQIMDNIKKTSHHLAQSQYPLQLLLPYAGQDGRYYHLDESGEYWRLFNYLENTTVLEQVEHAQQATAAAYAFGQFLSALWDFAPQQLHSTIPNFHLPSLRYKKLQQLIDQNPFQRRVHARTAIEFLHKQSILLQRFQPQDLPLRVTHNDTKISNVLFDHKKERGVAVIDLDTLMPGQIPFDFGVSSKRCPVSGTVASHTTLLSGVSNLSPFGIS
ncbi:MAG: aminoglycoside phosphotransferase family protein, partial [Bacteroidota bacterium]